MFNFKEIKNEDKETFYEELVTYVKHLIDGEHDLIANLANVSALLFNMMDKVNWAGFYLFKEGELVLGPFQGKVACIRIALGKGVCGSAAINRETQVVKDVHGFPGHIACDGDTNSEIVVPLIKGNALVGVLDIDSPILERFGDIDKFYLEKIASILMESYK